MFCNYRSAVVLGCASIGLFVASASAQVATLPEGGRVFSKPIVLAGDLDQVGLPQKTIYTVPAGAIFRVTDIALTAWNVDPGAFCIFDMEPLGELAAPGNQTSKFSFLTGPSYRPGQQVSVGRNARLPGGDGTCGITYTITGYLSERE